MEWEKMGGLVVLTLKKSVVGEGRLSVLVASLKMGCFEGLRVVASAEAGRSRRRDSMFS
jgi:hypothetical protein